MPEPVFTLNNPQLTQQEIASGSMQGWLDVHNVKNEKGDLITFHKHQWQIAIYNDQSDKLVVMKAAQVGMSTVEVYKNIRDAEVYGMDIIYTLPTDGDVNLFVGGKVNRIIANNPYLEALTADKDSIQQKQIGNNMIHFRGTFSKKAAIMIPADRLVHDEKDSSKQDVIADYQARLQHSKFKQTHVFSHPSVPNNGVDMEWQLSDQKEWFIKCPHCQRQQYLSWNTEDPKKMSIDILTRQFICKTCHGVLSWHDRAQGRWVARYKMGSTRKVDEREIIVEWSGYHVSAMMNPDITAGEVIDKYNEVQDGKQTMDFFYNKWLGLPYAGGGNSVPKESIIGAITTEKNLYQGRLVMGVDTGVDLRYVVGNKQGLVTYGQMKAYVPDKALGIPLEQSLEYFLLKFPTLIMVIDQGGDIVGSRQLRAKYPGRVFLCHYQQDRKTMQLVRWGAKDESGNVTADRNRMIQLVVDEYREKRLHLYNGDENAWYEYWLHFSHIYRIVELNDLGIRVYKWLRNDRDDWVHATVYWRIGMMKFGGQGGIITADAELTPDSYIVNPDNTVDFNPDAMFGQQGLPMGEAWWASDNDEDWRGVV